MDGTTVPFVKRTIDELRAHNPDITILLCKIIPISNQQTVRVGLVDYLNSKIDEIAEEKNRGNRRSRVIVVDQNQGFDSAKGVDTYDGMHPNAEGGEKMAKRFYSALQTHWRASPLARNGEVPDAALFESGNSLKASKGIPLLSSGPNNSGDHTGSKDSFEHDAEDQ